MFLGKGFCLMLDALLMKISLVLRGAFSENKLKNTEMAQRNFFSLLSSFGRTLSFICVHQGSTGPQKNIAPSNFLVKYLLQAEKFDIENIN